MSFGGRKEYWVAKMFRRGKIWRAKILRVNFNGFSIELVLEKCWMFHMNVFQHLFNSGEKYTFIDNQQPRVGRKNLRN